MDEASPEEVRFSLDLTRRVEEEMRRRDAAQVELTSAERFAVEAMRVFSNQPIIKAIDDRLMTMLERLDTLSAIIERPKSSNIPPQSVSSLVFEEISKLQQAHHVVRTIQTESVPAAYALSDTTVNNRLDVLERYRQDILNLPAVFQPEIPLRVRDSEPWRYAPAVWEALNERRWIAADSPTKYITRVANSKLNQRQAEEEKEHIDARLNGVQLVEKVLSREESGDDDGPALEVTEPVLDLSGLTALDLSVLPEEIITCVKMVRDGRKQCEIAKHLGTDTSHLLQKIRRIIEKQPPGFHALLKGRTNYAQFAPSMFTEDLAALTAKMRAHMTTKLQRPVTKVQKPDVTRSRPGQISSYRRLWLNNFNDRVCGNSDF